MGQLKGEQVVVPGDEKLNFERDGYLKFDPEIPHDAIDRVVSDLDAKYLWKGGDVVYEGGVVYSPGKTPRIRDAWRINEDVKEIALAPKVLAMLESIYGRKPLPFQSLNFPMGTQQAVHSDAMHFVPADENYMCGVWVALEDVDMSNGPLVYYPGSHRLAFTSYEDVGFDADKEDYPSYEEFIKDRNSHYEEYIRGLLEDRGLQPEYGTLRKGEALIWASNLLHGGAPQEDKDRTRHSQVTHYLFEGSFAFHTPMRTEGDQEYWTEPTVIA